jgi:hypothetical protein
VPEGAPGAVRGALRRARVARALGPGLGPHLLEVRGGRRLVLVFRGTGWEAPLGGCRQEIRGRLEQVLGHPVDAFEVQCRDVPEKPAPRTASRPPNASGRDGDLHERLKRLGRRLAERGRTGAGEDGEIR